MALTLQPPPRSDFPRVWVQWFDSISRLLQAGSIPWDALDFSQSDHADIVTAQGGSTGQRYHLTAAEYTELQRSNNVASVSADTTLTDSHRTVLVTASGKTLTLPAASSARIGLDWTVALTVPGYVTIVPSGSNDLGVEDDSIVLEEQGSTVTVRCVSASAWVLV